MGVARCPVHSAELYFGALEAGWLCHVTLGGQALLSRPSAELFRPDRLIALLLWSRLTRQVSRALTLGRLGPAALSLRNPPPAWAWPRVTAR